MLIAVIDVRVNPESVEAFEKATLVNARHSVQEPGIARFDVLRDSADPAHFVFIEVYRDPDAPRTPQGNRPLRPMARHRGGDDGATAQLRQVRERFPGRRQMVSGIC
jgi:hypothetical protein